MTILLFQKKFGQAIVRSVGESIAELTLSISRQAFLTFLANSGEPSYPGCVLVTSHPFHTQVASVETQNSPRSLA